MITGETKRRDREIREPQGDSGGRHAMTAEHQAYGASRTDWPTQNIRDGFSFQENKTGM